MRITLGDVTLQCIKGDIVDQPDIDVIVNAANAELTTGGGVAGAIHDKAGPELATATAPLAPIEPGKAVITDGFGLANPKIIHALGPVYGRDEPAAELLASCYANALILAEEAGLASIAFPAISAGAFGYPLSEAAEIALNTVASVAPELKSLKTIRFVLWDQQSFDAFSQQLIRTGAAAQAG